MDNWGEIDENPDDEEQLWDGGISDDDENNKEEKQEYVTTFEQEVSAQATKDQAISCGDPIPYHIKPGTKEYSQAIANKTPLERFKLEVDYVSRLLNLENVILSVDDRNTMCEKANDTQIVDIDPKYLNALAYVLGYIADKMNAVIDMKKDTEKEKKIKVTKMKTIIGNPSDSFSLLQSINDEASKARSGNSFAVYPADVIRYAQMWGKLK
jgi:hypothetical protein